MRQTLINAYLDFINNYLTIEKFAEHKGLTANQATMLLRLARDVYLTPHPEA